MAILLVRASGRKPGRGLDGEGSGRGRDVRGGHHDDGDSGRGRQHGQKRAGGLEIVGLWTGERRPETEANRSAGMMGMDVAETAASGRAVDGAMVLFEIEM